eukprot:gene20608-48680_t
MGLMDPVLMEGVELPYASPYVAMRPADAQGGRPLYNWTYAFSPLFESDLAQTLPSWLPPEPIYSFYPGDGPASTREALPPALNGHGIFEAAPLPLAGMRATTLPLAGMRATTLPLAGMRATTLMPLAGMRATTLPLAGMRATTLPLAGMRATTLIDFSVEDWSRYVADTAAASSGLLVVIVDGSGVDEVILVFNGGDCREDGPAFEMAQSMGITDAQIAGALAASVPPAAVAAPGVHVGPGGNAHRAVYAASDLAVAVRDG